MAFIEKVKSFFTTNDPVTDPSVFNDPLALKVEWKPLISGGSNFSTRELFEINKHRFEFKATTGAKIFYFSFFFLGLGLLIMPSIYLIRHGKPIWTEWATALMFITGFVWTIVGGSLYYRGNTPIVFDKCTGYFWKGRKCPDDPSNVDSNEYFTDLANIYALQIVSEYCSNEDNSFYSYELNLVLADATRINVVDHGKIDALLYDTRKLAGFLDVPVWNATE